MLKTKKIYPAYVSKHNSNRKNQVIFSMISKRKRVILQQKNYLA